MKTSTSRIFIAAAGLMFFVLTAASPYIPVDEIKTGAGTKNIVGNCGTWQQNGDKVNITWHDGDKSEKEWPGNNSFSPYTPKIREQKNSDAR